jgi:ABC-type sugar transport system permease subunit
MNRPFQDKSLSAAAASRFGAMRRKLGSDPFAAYIYLLPAIVLFTVFWFYPTGMLFYDSLFDWDGISQRIFIGWDNYTDLFTDGEFRDTLKNTFIFILGTVPAGIVLGLILALFLRKRIPGRGVFRTIFFCPVVTSYVAAGMVWVWLLNFDYGILNLLLNRIGLEKVPWLISERTAMLSVVLMTIWKDAGFNMVLFLGGLSSIDAAYYEAALLDGADRWQIFWGVTWPLLMPTTVFVLVTRMIFTFRTFEQIYAMTRGGPVGATRVFIYYIYEKAFQNFELGYASAAAVVLLLLVLLLTLLQFKLVKQKY